MLSSYTQSRPKSAVKLSLDAMKLPTNTGLKLCIHQKHHVSYANFTAGNPQISKCPFHANSGSIEFKSPFSLRKTSIFQFRKPSEFNGLTMTSPRNPIRNAFIRDKRQDQLENAIKISLIKKIDSSQMIKKVIKIPTLSGIKVLGKKLEYSSSCETNKKLKIISRVEASKGNYTIESPKNTVNITLRSSIPVTRKCGNAVANSDDEDSSRSILHLKSKYDQADVKKECSNSLEKTQHKKVGKKKKRKLKACTLKKKRKSVVHKLLSHV
jgi:hypothetical protein